MVMKIISCTFYIRSRILLLVTTTTTLARVAVDLISTPTLASTTVVEQGFFIAPRASRPLINSFADQGYCDFERYNERSCRVHIIPYQTSPKSNRKRHHQPKVW